MWSFEKKTDYSTAELVKKISSEDVEGVTILSGEPLDQLSEVYTLCHKCQQLGLSTMVFTGYELSEINNTDKSIIKSVSDILIVGRYDESLRTIDNQWIGSTNQQILFLTKRYADYEIQDANYMEIDIDENGKCTLLGFPGDL
jgi:anaerobic ribonucleoside-triphosphate reductase activating protein